jgi:hypothetical protein
MEGDALGRVKKTGPGLDLAFWVGVGTGNGVTGGVPRGNGVP